LSKTAGWVKGVLAERRSETSTAVTLTFDVADWPGHRAGQHLDLRLTSEDGYQASRSYSIASPPEERAVGLTIERFPDGEVSPYLVDVMQPGDELELRGPIGGWFVWEADSTDPIFLIGGGSGIVPLMAMLRHRAAARGAAPARLLVSARNIDSLIYREELEQLEGDAEIVRTFTREAPPGWEGYARRIDRAMLEEVAWPPATRATTYICGPTAFVETAADALVSLGHDQALIRTERFGPTGG
jgi:ferredoxin-NADP reductase